MVWDYSLSLQDLIEDDVMIVDCFDEIFVWIGDMANEVERKNGLKIAMVSPCSLLVSPFSLAVALMRSLSG